MKLNLYGNAAAWALTASLFLLIAVLTCCLYGLFTVLGLHP